VVAPLELGVSSIFFIATIAGPPVEYITSSTILLRSKVQSIDKTEVPPCYKLKHVKVVAIE